MNPTLWNAKEKESLETILGILNFSSGEAAPKFLIALNDVCGRLEELKAAEDETPLWRRLAAVLWDYLKFIQPTSEVFSRDLQVRQSLLFGFRYFFPYYRVWHKDLLFHQKDDTLFNAFSIGEAFYAILKERAFEAIPEENADLESSDVFLKMGVHRINLENSTENTSGNSTDCGSENTVENVVEKAAENAVENLTEISVTPVWEKPSAFMQTLPEMSPEIQVTLRRIIGRYDDFIGYRPIPVLHSKQKMQPYRHEWLHAVPLYIQGVGVVHGPYHEMISRALNILQNTDEFLLADAMFDFSRLEELTFDPRALDFEHPVNRRLNYHFGSWDPMSITNKGYYNRFVLIESTIKSIFSRVNSSLTDEHNIPADELLTEASAVLAGTLLMGASVSSWGPGARTSSDTFASLLPKVAKLRDSFYQELLGHMPEGHAARLNEEAKILHQPFAAARQYFNRNLARQRAEQYQNVQLARLYAWMGYSDASNELVMKVNVPAARMRCEIDCLLTKAHLAVDHDHALDAIPMLYRIEDILHEGIECGALVDPWYVLGFDGQYPLSSSVEDSTQDQRIDELVLLVGSIFSLYSRLLKEMAAKGLMKKQSELMFRMQEITQWWDQFGTMDVSEIKSISGAETYDSANLVVNALGAWYEGGTEAGDIAFWRPRVADFTSAKAYSLLIEALLDQKDPVASMALLINWLSQSEFIKLDDGDYSFHPLALRWMEDLWYPPTKEQRLLCRRGSNVQDGWKLAKRFVDLVEANAEQYGIIPELELDADGGKSGKSEKKNRRKRNSDSRNSENEEMNTLETGNLEGSGISDGLEEESLDDLFNAAWEDVTYHDSTDDGVDDSMMDGESLKHSMEDFPLTSEMERISDRLVFIITQARLWKMSAVFSIPFAEQHPDREEVLGAWSAQVETYLKGLHRLIEEVKKFHVEEPDFTRPIAMMEYEKQIGMKYALLERIVSTCSELMDAQRLMRISDVKNRITATDTWENATRSVMQALICSDTALVKKIWSKTTALLAREPILYVPIDRGGDPVRMIRIRNILTVIQRLLVNLPLQGLLSETYQILKTVQTMEKEHPVGMRAITRYDHLFDLGSKGILRTILRSGNKPGRQKWALKTLIPILDETLDVLLNNWISHSHGIRISMLDPFQDPRSWKGLRDFIKNYGEDLFSPVLMSYSNLQAIHHQGVVSWLDSLIENLENNPNASEEDEIQGRKLVADIQAGKYPRYRAEQMLDVVVETLLERYGQFIDYNTTTTQSDCGENLYILFDFLRLLGEYDRLAWDIRPFINAHNVMVREKNYDVADSWFESIEDRSAYQAKQFIRRYRKLCLKHGIIVKTVADRLEERFVKPMAINKLCALLEPAIQESRAGAETPSFTKFLELVKEFTAEASGTGYEPPAWLEEIEDEINSYRNRSEDDDEMLDLKDFIPQKLMLKTEIHGVLYELQAQEHLNGSPNLDESFESMKELLGNNLPDPQQLEMILNDTSDLSMEEIEEKLKSFWEEKKSKKSSKHSNGEEDDEDSDDENEDENFRKLFE